MTLRNLNVPTKAVPDAFLLLLTALTGLCVLPFSAKAGGTPSTTAGVVQAAQAFLSTLTDKQRAAVIYKFNDDAQRARWSNLPTGFVPRGGLRLKDLSDAQRAAAMALMKSVLSEKGFHKVEEIRGADDAFKAAPHRPPPPGNGNNGPSPGGPPPPGNFGGGGPDHEMFGSDLYYISFVGTPSEKDPWMLQFGGHHLALNITVVGEHGVLTPSLTGAQPTTYESNGKTVRPIGAENDKGFALIAALSDDQRKQAVLNYRVGDLVLGPGHDGEKIQPEGLKVSAMNEHQQAMLLDLISEWAGIVNDAYAAPRMAEIKAGLQDTWFAWSGPTSVEPGKNGTSYYRIQGPKLVIEFAPQRGDDHVHTIYRDPTNDYGRSFTAP